MLDFVVVVVVVEIGLVVVVVDIGLVDVVVVDIGLVVVPTVVVVEIGFVVVVVVGTVVEIGLVVVGGAARLQTAGKFAEQKLFATEYCATIGASSPYNPLEHTAEPRSANLPEARTCGREETARANGVKIVSNMFGAEEQTVCIDCAQKSDKITKGSDETA